MKLKTLSFNMSYNPQGLMGTMEAIWYKFAEDHRMAFTLSNGQRTITRALFEAFNRKTRDIKSTDL
jgi:hypothetical protein